MGILHTEMKPMAGTYAVEVEPVRLHGYFTRWVRSADFRVPARHGVRSESPPLLTADGGR